MGGEVNGETESELYNQVKGVISHYDFGPLLKSISEIYPNTEDAQLRDVRAVMIADELIAKITGAVLQAQNVQKLDWVSRKLVETVLSAFFKNQEFEVRFYSDLLNPATAGAFNNHIPEEVWKKLRSMAEEALKTPEKCAELSKEHLAHLTELAAGKTTVQVGTETYQQWLHINSLALLSESFPGNIVTPLSDLAKLPIGVQNFLKEQHAVLSKEESPGPEFGKK